MWTPRAPSLDPPLRFKYARDKHSLDITIFISFQGVLGHRESCISFLEGREAGGGGGGVVGEVQRGEVHVVYCHASPNQRRRLGAL